MNPFKSGWYLIYTRPQQERRIAAQLSTEEITFFLPSITVERQWHDRVKKMPELLFPSYVFIYLKNLLEYFNVLDLKGVSYYVKQDKQPVIVPESLIEQIRLVVDHKENISTSTEHFMPAQQIIIERGSLKGLTGEVIQHMGKEKILIRVKLLNRSILVDLPANYLTDLRKAV